jgi:hypothetical protein
VRSTIRSKFLVAAICTTFLASVAIGAQLSGTMSGPIMGYIFDSAEGKLRPLRGIPGSATIGAPIDTDVALSQVWTLDANHVIASADSSPELMLLSLAVSPPSFNAMSGIPANPSRAVASLDGTSAVFYYDGTQEVKIATGLPENPVVAHTLKLSLLGKLTQLAVSKDGALLVYSDSGSEIGGEGGSLHAWTASSNLDRFLAPAGSIGAIAITGNGAAIIADRSTNEVFAIWDVAGASSLQFLAGPGDGVSNPAGVAVSPANQIFIVNAGTGTVISLDPSGRYRETLDCNCDLSGVFALRDSEFRLTDRVHQTIYLLDASSTAARILFVPPAKDGL